ncbi:MAG TPA: 4Fe-4S dicluster domain-containing protein, partial [Aestuariivirga sp.]|nr:4Fe-4S dicluster domain-containing protein [Aestuariivirga sp.]
GDGREVLGPQVRDGAIVHEPISGAGDLPRGLVDDQSGGSYRLRRDGDALFGYTVGPQSWKRQLHPPRQSLWRSQRNGDQVSIVPEPEDETRRAFFAVRPCELAAIAIQDRVFTGGPYRDAHYAARRERAFIVAVNCGRAAATCFCTSMGTGPRANGGYDIALTEIATGGIGTFLAEAGSDEGAALLQSLSAKEATADDRNAAQQVVDRTAASITRRLDTEDLPALLKSNPQHRRWDDVAARCLSCGNCTMVCPTCFCTTVEDTSELDGSGTARVSRWDSCFTSDFTYVHGGAVRESTRSHYRQWMTHKLATWHDQFDTSGCVGCGRCITWCPVGIDITEEAAAIRQSPATVEETP